MVLKASSDLLLDRLLRFPLVLGSLIYLFFSLLLFGLFIRPPMVLGHWLVWLIEFGGRNYELHPDPELVESHMTQLSVMSLVILV